jgi:hypothetical protein
VLNETASEGNASDKKYQMDSKYLHGLFQSLVLGTKATNSLPTEDDDEFHHFTSVPEISEKAGDQGERILNLIQNLMSHVSPTNGFDITEMDDATDSEALEGMTGVVDVLLEKVDSFHDKVW